MMRMIWRGRMRLAMWILFGCLLGAVFVFLRPDAEYRATALIRFEYNENLPDQANPAFWRRGGGTEITSEIVTLTSAAMLGKLIDHLTESGNAEALADLRGREGFGAAFATSQQDEREQLILRLSEVLKAKPIDKSYVYEITAKSKSAHHAEVLANSLAELSVAEAIAHARARAEKASRWFATKAGAIKAELDQTEIAINQFIEESNYTSERDLRQLRKRAREIRLAQQKLLLDTDESKGKLEEILAIKDGADFDLVAQLTGDPVLMTMVRDAAFDKPEFDQRLNQVISRYRTTKTRHEKRLVAMKKNLSELEFQIEAQAKEALRLQELRREKEANSALYENYLSRLKEAVASKNLALSERRIISLGHAVSVQKIPDIGAILLFGIIALLTALTISFAKELYQKRVRTIEDLEDSLGHPALLEIPLEALGRARHILRAARERPDVAISASWRKLRTIFEGRKAKSIYVTSAQSGAGKSLTALGLASIYAATGKKVLLIDANPFHQGLAEMLEVQANHQGYTNALLNNESLDAHSVPTGLGDIDLLQTGDFIAQAADLISGLGFQALVRQAIGKYDIVIFDGDAVLPDGLSVALAAIADQTLLLVEWDKTQRVHVKKAFATLYDTGAKPSLILSQVHAEKLESYGYPPLHPA